MNLSKHLPVELNEISPCKSVIATIYEGEFTAAAMIVLGEMISQFSKQHPGCVVRIRSVVQDLDYATVEIEVDEFGSVDLERIRRDWEKIQTTQRCQECRIVQCTCVDSALELGNGK